MSTFAKLLNECIENEGSYFRNGEKKQEVLDYVAALEAKITMLEAQSQKQAIDVIEEIPVLVELAEVESAPETKEEFIKRVKGSKPVEPIYEIVFHYKTEDDPEGETFVQWRHIQARNFYAASGEAHSIRDRDFRGRHCKIVMIKELE